MNWKEIKEKYPKVWNELIQFKDEFGRVFVYLYYRYELCIKEDYCSNDFHLRELYDFFDENEIYITITADYYGINEYHPLEYSGDKEDVYYWINVNWVHEDNVEYKTRTEAEESAFEKAFEILEQKL